MTHARQLITSTASVRGLSSLLAAASLLAASGIPALAQVQNFLLKPGSNVGPATEVKATDCVTKPDGTITCNTKLVNPPGDTPAKPIYSPFKN
ncbi:MAG: hypothetical protein ACKOZT_12110 [Cyanobium sp.]